MPYSYGKRMRRPDGSYTAPRFYSTRKGYKVTRSFLRANKMARGMTSRRAITNMVNRTYRFKRTVVIEGLLQSGTAALPGGCVVGMSFSLGQINVNRSIQNGAVTVINTAVPAVTEMQNLFQQWKIEKVIVRIVPSRPDADIASGIPVSPLIASFPTLLSVTDYDDNNATTTVAPLQEHGDCKITMLDGIKSFAVVPKFVGVVTGAPGTTVAGPPTRGYLDCEQPNIEHNGIKFGLISQANYAASAYIDIFYTMRGTK